MYVKWGKIVLNDTKEFVDSLKNYFCNVGQKMSANINYKPNFKPKINRMINSMWLEI